MQHDFCIVRQPRLLADYEDDLAGPQSISIIARLVNDDASRTGFCERQSK